MSHFQNIRKKCLWWAKPYGDILNSDSTILHTFSSLRHVFIGCFVLRLINSSLKVDSLNLIYSHKINTSNRYISQKQTKNIKWLILLSHIGNMFTNVTTKTQPVNFEKSPLFWTHHVYSYILPDTYKMNNMFYFQFCIVPEYILSFLDPRLYLYYLK